MNKNPEEEKRKYIFSTRMSPVNFMITFKILNSRFPKCFTMENVRPLKVGIRQDIAPYLDELKISKAKFSRFAMMYANSPEYMKAHIVGAERIDLDGNVSGVVSESQQQEKEKTYKLFLKHVIKEENKITEDKNKETT